MRRARGFTLVEVLVAMALMALMAAMAWRGIDGLLKSREVAQASVDRSTRLQTVMAQWEQDLAELQESQVVPALDFDGRHLRMTRRSPEGLQVVVWWVAEGRWWRWASAPLTNVADLLRAHERAQQSTTLAAQALAVLPGVEGWQLAYFRGNAWTNAMSSADLEAAAATAAKDAATATGSTPPAGGTGTGTGTGAGTEAGAGTGAGTGTGTGTPTTGQAEARVLLPAGIRLQVTFQGGSGWGGPLTKVTAVPGGA